MDKKSPDVSPPDVSPLDELKAAYDAAIITWRESAWWAAFDTYALNIARDAYEEALIKDKASKNE